MFEKPPRSVPLLLLNSVRSFSVGQGAPTPLPTLLVDHLITTLRLDRLVFHHTKVDTAISQSVATKGTGLTALRDQVLGPDAETIAIGDSEATCRRSRRPRVASPLHRFFAGNRREPWTDGFRLMVSNGACSILYVRLADSETCFWTCYKQRTVPWPWRWSARSFIAPPSDFCEVQPPDGHGSEPIRGTRRTCWDHRPALLPLA